MPSLDVLIDKARCLLHESHHAVALTGAGISTPSGIPDFRSANSGLWDKVDPMEVASLDSFQERPNLFYDWIHPLAHLILAAHPNAAHLALAQMESHGPLKCVITQNIDMLHSKAGSAVVHEVHGHLRQATCLHCGRVYNAEKFLTQFIATRQLPLCPHCNGVLKPNVVLFGEMLPAHTFHQAQWQAQSCDLMIVAGSSLEVFPVADLPRVAKRAGAKLIIVNFSETYMDHLADVVIRADVTQVLPQFVSYTAPGHKLTFC